MRIANNITNFKKLTIGKKNYFKIANRQFFNKAVFLSISPVKIRIFLIFLDGCVGNYISFPMVYNTCMLAL